MKIKELRSLTDAEIKAKCKEAKQEIFNLRIQKLTGQLEKPHRIRELKRIIARGKTLLTERFLKNQCSSERALKSDAK